MVNFSYEEDGKLTICEITYKNNTFIGTAFCAPEDEDMMNKRTGETIASIRAQIAYYQHIRDNEILPGLAALKQLFYSMNNSKSYNKDSYEARRIRKKIYQYEEDLKTIRGLIQESREYLKEYLDVKEKLFLHLRMNKIDKDGGMLDQSKL